MQKKNGNAKCTDNTDLVEVLLIRNNKIGIQLNCSYFKLLNQAKLKILSFQDYFFILLSKYSKYSYSCEEQLGIKLIPSKDPE